MPSTKIAVRPAAPGGSGGGGAPPPGGGDADGGRENRLTEHGHPVVSTWTLVELGLECWNPELQLGRREIGRIYLYRRNFMGGFHGVSEVFLTPRKTTV